MIPLLANMLESSLLPAAMVILAMVVGMWTLRRAQQRSRRRTASPREQIDSVRHATAARQSMQDLMIDLESFARKMNAQLDTKFARLEAVIRDADERIAQLKALQGAAGEEPAAAAEASQSAEAAPAKPSEPPPPAQEPPRPSQPRRRRSAASASASPAGPSKPVPDSHEPRAKRVCELADAGWSSIQIAEEVGLTLGEVEVILQLRQAS